MQCANFPTTRTMVASSAFTSKSGVALDLRTFTLLGAALFCALAPLDISHLFAAVLGAAGYLLLQAMHPQLDRKGAAKTSPRSLNAKAHLFAAAAPAEPRRTPARAPQVARAPVKAEVRRPTTAPIVAAPTFRADGFEAEVKELLDRVAPTPEGEAAVAQIVRAVRRAVWPIFPEAEVAGFAGSSLICGTAFGVAVPEVDIVVTVSPEVLVGRLQGRWGSSRGAAEIDANKLQKSAIRACTDRLVGAAAFKFRRSAFRGAEPKVTLLAPPTPSSGDQAVPINLSVNAVTPFYAAALLAECGQKDPRAKALILLVRRWAKDRGLSHAAKGHLTPYTWTLLVIYFLQVGLPGNGKPLLPPLRDFEVSSGLTRTKRARGNESAAPRALRTCGAAASSMPVGDLFKAFIRFYAQDFDWRSEAVCPRAGRRAPPDLALPLHIMLQEDGQTTEVGPSIEDPFEERSNLGNVMTVDSFARLHDELKRADDMCTSDASLASLLEPWAPPEALAGATSPSVGDEED